MAFSLGGFLGSIATEALGQLTNGDDTPTPSTTPVVVAGIPNQGGNGGSFLSALPAKATAVSVLRLIAAGAGDSQVRVAARKAQVSKTDLFDALTAIEVMGKSMLSRLERIAISDQIDRIFRKRPRPIISKGLKRTMKQMEFMMKFAKKFGGSPSRHAHFTTKTTGHK